MSGPPTEIVDRGTWMFYATAAFAVVMSLCLLVLGIWPGAVVGLGLAGWIGSHPYLRREWYFVGYRQGYLDAVKAVRVPEEP
jgi:ABC-type nitrate/sulfonate/bicarbonate transport system permease component